MEAISTTYKKSENVKLHQDLNLMHLDEARKIHNLYQFDFIFHLFLRISLSSATASMLAEHKEHKGTITGLAFSPNGEHMYSAGSQGILILYEGSTDDFSVQRMLVNTVARGDHFAPDVLAVSDDAQRLAIIGPSEYVVTVMDTRTLDEVGVAAYLFNQKRVSFSKSAAGLLPFRSDFYTTDLTKSTGLMQLDDKLHQVSGISACVSGIKTIEYSFPFQQACQPGINDIRR